MTASKAYQIIGPIDFPKPKGIIINMMPFILGDKNSLPEDVRHYNDLIEKCHIESELNGKVGYLTVTETIAKKNSSHRRGGVHVEAHPAHSWGGGGWGGGSWGKGFNDGRMRKEGIYVASTVANTTRVWDSIDSEMGEGGSLEHKTDTYHELNGVTLKQNELCWFTDKTPHESVPVSENVYRQFFRLVTPNVGVWFKSKSTANPLGVLPNCKVV